MKVTDMLPSISMSFPDDWTVDALGVEDLLARAEEKMLSEEFAGVDTGARDFFISMIGSLRLQQVESAKFLIAMHYSVEPFTMKVTNAANEDENSETITDITTLILMVAQRRPFPRRSAKEQGSINQMFLAIKRAASGDIEEGGLFESGGLIGDPILIQNENYRGFRFTQAQTVTDAEGEELPISISDTFVLEDPHSKHDGLFIQFFTPTLVFLEGLMRLFGEIVGTLRFEQEEPQS